METRGNAGNWKILVLFIVLSLFLFSNSLSNPFHYDDHHHIVENPHLKKLGNIPEYFYNTGMFSQSAEARHYRPLLLTTYALNYALGGLNPSGYRMVNLLFHTGSAFLVFLIVLGITGRGKQKGLYYSALSAGLIFLVLPFNSEVVNYISARSTVMCAFFYLLSFYCWIKYRERSSQGFFVTSVIAFVLALLTKEIAITLPLIIVLYDIYFERDRIFKKSFASNILSYLPYFILVLLPYILATLFLLSHKKLQVSHRPILTQLSTELVVFIKYIRLMILPYGLTVYHDIPVSGEISPFVIFSGIIILLIIASAIYLLIKNRSDELLLVSFMSIFFFIVMLPTSMITLNVILQENRGYLSAVSAAVIGGILIGKLRNKNSYMFIAVLSIVTIIYFSITFKRTYIWNSEITMWSDVISKYPASETAHINLSMAYHRNNMIQEAVSELNTMISIKPDSFPAHKNLGWIYRSLGDFPKAFEELETAARIKPEDAILQNDLGALYLEKKLYPQSEQHLIKAIELDNDYMTPRFNIGIAYTAQGKTEPAEAQFKAILSTDPKNINAMKMLNIINNMKLKRTIK